MRQPDWELGMGKYSGSSENSFDQRNCSDKFPWGILPVGSKMIEMTHRKRNSILTALKGRENIKVVGMEGEKYDGGADDNG